MSRLQLERVLAKCRMIGAHLLVDECFMDFVCEGKAYSLRDLLANYPERSAVRRYAENFSWDETTQRQLALFSEICGRKG